MNMPMGDLSHLAAQGVDLSAIQDRIPNKREQMKMYSLNIALQAMRSDTTQHPPLPDCDGLVAAAEKVYGYITRGG